MDLIERQAAIDALKGLPTWWADGGGYHGGAQPPMEALLDPEDAVSAIENLPSAQPERMKGKWKRHYCEDGNPDGWRCDNCDEWYYFGQTLPNFCPNCGADMRGEQDE